MAAKHTKSKRPIRILASYLMDDPNVSPTYSNELHQLATNASRTLAQVADDVQVVFANALEPTASIESLLETIDGILLLGGTDVDPHHYTDSPDRIAEAKAYSSSADAFEMALAKSASDQGMPVLGICRGEQLINVAFGGSLITDLGPTHMHTHPGNDDWYSHPVTAAEGSRLSQIYPERTFDVQSSHHQAVDVVAPGFTVAASAPDGIIEAIESIGRRWILGVQWHPEASEADASHFAHLSEAFIDEARKSRAARNSFIDSQSVTQS